MKIKYNQEFREQAVQKTLNRGDQTIEEIADTLSVNSYTHETSLGALKPDILLAPNIYVIY